MATMSTLTTKMIMVNVITLAMLAMVLSADGTEISSPGKSDGRLVITIKKGKASSDNIHIPKDKLPSNSRTKKSLQSTEKDKDLKETTEGITIAEEEEPEKLPTPAALAAEEAEELPTPAALAAEEPEELPSPAALTFPVPSFIANLFSSDATPRQAPPANPRSRNIAQRRPQRRNFTPPQRDSSRDSQRDSPRDSPRRTNRKADRSRSRQQQRSSEDYYYGNDPVGLGDDYVSERVTEGRANIRESYNYNSDSSYAPLAIAPNKNARRETNNFEPSLLSNENKNEKKPMRRNKFEYYNDKVTPRIRNQKNTKKDDLFDYSVLRRDEDTFRQIDIPYEDYPILMDYDNYFYDYDLQLPRKDDKEKRYSNHKYTSEEETPFFGGFLDSMRALNPLNYFTSSKEESPSMSPSENSPKYKNPRRSGSKGSQRKQKFPELREHYDENPIITDYIDFSSLELFHNKQNDRYNRPNYDIRYPDYDVVPVKYMNQRQLRNRFTDNEEKHLMERDQTNQRKRNTGLARPTKRYRINRPASDDFSDLDEADDVFKGRNKFPHPPLGFDPRRKNDNKNKEKLKENKMMDQSDRTFNSRSNNEFPITVTNNDLIFEDDPQPLPYDPRLEPFEYKDDFPLREDLYIGKDGNIYLKDRKDSQTKTATLTDSDSLLGLHMYGMDHPLFQEVSKPKVTYINNPTRKTTPRRIHKKKSRPTSTTRPKLKIRLAPQGKINYQRNLSKMKTTAHKRPTTGKPSPSTVTVPRRNRPTYYESSDEITPYVSEFAKNLVKIKKSRQLANDDKRDDTIDHNLKD